MRARYLRWDMSESSDELVAEVETRREAALATVAQIDAVDAMQAERIGASIDRVASGLHELSPPPHGPPRSA
jgi:hypothetical protein